MRFAAEHSQLSAAILRKYSPRRLPKHGCMDQALIGKAGVTKALQQHSKTLDTILEFNSAVPSSARVHYLPGAITRQRAEEIVATIPVALERILDLPDIRINDILWGETERTALEQDVSVVELSHEFQFGD